MMSEQQDNKPDVGSGNDAGVDESPVETSTTETANRKSRKGLYTLLVLLLIGVAALVSPAQFKAVFHALNEKLAPVQAPPVQVKQAEAPVVVQKPVKQPAPKPPVVVERQPVRTAQAPAVSSEEIQQLLNTIDDLRGELGQLGNDQRKLRAALREQQRMNLQVRLRWVIDPAARLPQMQLAWEEISLLPGLSDEQRSLAVKMHSLAQSDVERLHQWRLAIQKWADTLSVPAHKDILPRPEHPWLAWIVSQFHLRQAPSQEARKLSDMRHRLLETARLLRLESWPDAGAWQRLRAELLLQVKAHARDAEAAVDLGLPDDFEAIQQDIRSLRQSARAWLEQY